MFEISIQGQGSSQFDRMLGKFKTIDRPLGEIGGFLERKAKLRAVKEIAPDGTPWAELRPSTMAKKKTGFAYRKGRRVSVPSKFIGSILRETGGMIASIAFRVSGNAVTVKPSVDYAIYHQLGTNRMPARPFMGFEEGDPDAIAQIISDYLGS